MLAAQVGASMYGVRTDNFAKERVKNVLGFEDAEEYLYWLLNVNKLPNPYGL